MSNQRNNIMVAIFVLGGLAGVAWMLVLFRDLPTQFSRYGALEVAIRFPSAPGVQKNTSVSFRGFTVGRVVEVAPPTLMAPLEGSGVESYQVLVTVAIDDEYPIPNTIVPKVFQRGLGSSFLELTLPEGAETTAMLADGDELQGAVSTGSEFISEETQQKLDTLIVSMTRLSEGIQGQLFSVPPEAVDGASPEAPVAPNLTTAIMRMDQALKHVNTLIGDDQMQQDVKEGLSQFAEFSREIRGVVSQMQSFMEKAAGLVERTSETVTSVEGVAENFHESFHQTGLKVQTAADELARALQQVNQVLTQVADGQGTLGRVLNDPRLYETMASTGENLNLAVEEFRELIAELTRYGIINFKGKKD